MPPSPPPRIALNASLLAREGPGLSVSLKVAYCDAILEAGGIPSLLPPIEDEAALGRALESADGVMLVGGDDMDPRRYGAEPSPLTIPLAPRREAFDFGLMAAALETRKPVLAICLGFQVLNVHFGGTLYQDIPAGFPESEVCHGRKIDPDSVRHAIHVEEGSLLERIVGQREFNANSGHHQGVRSVGVGLRISARAPDGLVEALEIPDHPFALGVQWHPEDLTDEAPHRALFTAFVEACSVRT